VGTNNELLSNELFASELNFVSGDPLHEPMDVTAKIRYKSPEAKAVLYPQGLQAWLVFEEPQRAVTPGQAVVFYRDDVLVGGGIIN
jgi:tRNA-specific 2-thiouridylase